MSELLRIQAIWQNQEAESLPMPTTDMKRRAQRFHSQIERRNIVEYVAGAGVIAVFAYIALLVPTVWMKGACALIILGAIYAGWKLHTSATASPLEFKNPAQTWVTFYRGELVRQRDVLLSVWRWYLAPFLPGVTCFLASIAFTPELLAPLLAKFVVFALGVVLAVAIFALIGWLNAAASKQIEAEIQALDDACR